MLAITIMLFVLVAVFVDLKPVVDENFFFSSGDPGVEQSKKVEQRFPSEPQLVLAVTPRDITSSRYLSLNLFFIIIAWRYFPGVLASRFFSEASGRAVFVRWLLRDV